MDPLQEIDRHVGRKFDVGQKLGKGAYGIVWKATERRSGQVVALKKIFDAFQNATDAQRTFREIIFLKQMSNHENIIRLDDVMKAENDRDIYLVFEFMETDLHAAIRASILQDVHKQYIVYQAFKALMYMHSAKLMHRDMKPANLLLNAECLMKVADFGLARSLVAADGGNADGGTCTDYVATRWYRAPEILVASSKYGTAVDLWSMGCIFAEMLGGEPAFTGKTTLNQIEKIVQMLGFPTEADIASLKSDYTKSLLDNIDPSGLSEAAPSSTSRCPPPCDEETVRERWRTKYKAPPSSASEEAIDLLHALLTLNPDTRLTAEKALVHPYCAAFHDQASAFSSQTNVETHQLDDNTKQSTAVYREKLYGMIPFKEGKAERAANGHFPSRRAGR